MLLSILSHPLRCHPSRLSEIGVMQRNQREIGTSGRASAVRVAARVSESWGGEQAVIHLRSIPHVSNGPEPGKAHLLEQEFRIPLVAAKQVPLIEHAVLENPDRKST